MTEEWKPLPVRMGWEKGYDALHEGIPDWLRESLTDWVRARLWHEGNVRTDLLHEIERVLRKPLDWTGPVWETVDFVLRWARTNPNAFLAVLDFLLVRFPLDEAGAEALALIIDQGGSAWTVAWRGETFRLEQRVDEGVQATAETAMAASDPAAKFLSDAWHAMYGTSPDPAEAYGDAVRAVEAAAKPIIASRDSKATLGKMIKAIRDAPQKWTFTTSSEKVSGIGVVRDLMELVWTGHRGRHGDSTPTGPLEATSEEAEAALHAAATLVHWFRSGAIQEANS